MMLRLHTPLCVEFNSIYFFETRRHVGEVFFSFSPDQVTHVVHPTTDCEIHLRSVESTYIRVFQFRTD